MLMSRSRFFARGGATVVFLLGAAGCSPFPPAKPVSSVTLPARFEAAPAVGEAAAPGWALPVWWRAWHDPELDRLVQAALAANLDLRAARDRVKQARAYATVVDSALYPTVGLTGNIAGGGVNWRHPVSPLLHSVAPDIQDPATDGHLAGVGVAWEPDVFGSHHADSRAAGQMVLAAQDMVQGVHMAIAADVAANYLTAKGVQQRMALLERSVTVLAQLETYARARFDAGQATRADVQSITGQKQGIEAELPVLQATLDTCRHRLAILAGLPPEQAPKLDGPASYVTPPAPVGEVPVSVLDRRPDVRLRRAVVLADVERLTSARNQLLPHFGLEFFGGDGRLRFDGLPGLSGTGGLVALTTYLPVFTAGRVHAQIHAADARLDEAVAQYDQTLLTALGEVEDAYESRSSLNSRIESLVAQEASTSAAAQAARGLYEGGRMTMQDVLEARLRLIRVQDAVVEARTRQALATVGLARALGGGWGD